MATAETRHVRLHTPLGDGVLLPYKGHFIEELGRPFAFELELLSLDPALVLEDMVGLDCAVEMETAADPRLFHGFVSRFSHGGSLGRYTRYHATLRPLPWFLAHASDSRIFQGVSVVQVIKDVLALHDYTDVIDRLQEDHPVREYITQYNESDLDFIRRLMEEEGIYFHFEHEEKRHSIVLCDAPTSHKPHPDAEEFPFIPPTSSEQPRVEHLSTWTLTRQLATGAYVVNDFDFELPRADLRAVHQQPQPHARAEYERYEPVAGFVDAHDVKQGGEGDPRAEARAKLFARVRLEEQQTHALHAVAEGTLRLAACGACFTLTEHPREKDNEEYLVTRVEHQFFVPGYDAAEDARDQKEPLHRMRLVAQPTRLPFRPARMTPRPVIAGPHPGIVVGADGDEIMTDKFGRVKVRFPWDRNSSGKDDCGCWVRVSQPIAGASWGGLFLPRVGQEVIVEFVDGDIDRPVVTGRLYNGMNTPPFGMPGGATQSGFLTRSSKGGGAANANELRFEDKSGEEMFFQHAEKDMSTEVENDQTLWVGRDRTKTIDRNQVEEVKGNKKIKVHGTHIEDIDKTMSLKVGGNEDETIGGSRTIDVGANHTETIAGVQGVTVGGAAAWSVGGAGTINWGGVGAISVGGNLTFAVGGNLSQSVNQNASMDVSKNISFASGKKLTMDVGDEMGIAVKKKYVVAVEDEHKVTVKKAYGLKAKEIVVEAEDKLTLKSGDATIILEKGGDITIKGKKVNVKADNDVILKGSKVASN